MLTDLAYTAGILDGEGTFSIQKSSGTYRTTIQVQMTNITVVAWLYKQYGGHFGKREATGKDEELFIWVLGSKPKIAELLPEAIPYLKARELPARILLEFCTKFNIGKAGRYTDAQYEMMDKYHKILMLANSKGVGSNDVKSRLYKILTGATSA